MKKSGMFFGTFEEDETQCKTNGPHWFLRSFLSAFWQMYNSVIPLMLTQYLHIDEPSRALLWSR